MSDLKKASEPAKIIWDDESISKAVEPGNYEARAFFEGADKAGSRDGELLQIIVKVGDQTYSSDKVVLADWMNWQCAIVSDIKITNSMIEAGNNKVTVCADVAIKQDTWGSIDDFYLYKVSDVEDDSQPE